MENTTLCGTETKTFAVKREKNRLDFLHTVKSRGNLDEIVKSLFTGHCEARPARPGATEVGPCPREKTRSGPGAKRQSNPWPRPVMSNCGNGNPGSYASRSKSMFRLRRAKAGSLFQAVTANEIASLRSQ